MSIPLTEMNKFFPPAPDLTVPKGYKVKSYEDHLGRTRWSYHSEDGRSMGLNFSTKTRAIQGAQVCASIRD